MSPTIEQREVLDSICHRVVRTTTLNAARLGKPPAVPFIGHAGFGFASDIFDFRQPRQVCAFERVLGILPEGPLVYLRCPRSNSPAAPKHPRGVFADAWGRVEVTMPRCRKRRRGSR